MTTPKNGDLVCGKYRIEGLLGEGGMGVVLSATHEQLNRPVALKLLHTSEASHSPTALARFLREARAAAMLQSEHVVRVFDVGTLDDGMPYMVLEKLAGHDLGKLLESGEALSVEDSIDYVLQTCEGLAEAHAMGIVHRDLKPSNLFRVERKDGSQTIKILDFGIAKEMHPADGGLTGTSQAIGSPYYMSPEQVRSSKNVDRRTDIWALGIILHELVTQEPPFAGDTLGSVYAAIISDPPPSIDDVRPGLPPGLGAVIARCLAKAPADRYASVAELARELAPFCARGAGAVERITKLAATESGGHEAFAATQSAADSGVSPLAATAGAESAPAAGTGTAPQAQTGGAWGGTQAPGERAASKPRYAPLWIAAAATLVVLLGGSLFFLSKHSSATASAPKSDPTQPEVKQTAAALATPPPESSAPTPSALPPPPATSAPSAASSSKPTPIHRVTTDAGAPHGTPASTNEGYDDRK